jgi:hypothetical protein
MCLIRCSCRFTNALRTALSLEELELRALHPLMPSHLVGDYEEGKKLSGSASVQIEAHGLRAERSPELNPNDENALSLWESGLRHGIEPENVTNHGLLRLRFRAIMIFTPV